MDLKQHHTPLLLAFIALSLLLHLAVLALIPQRSFIPPPEPEPVYVEVRRPESRALPRELDLPPAPPQQPERTEPAKRLGPADQVATQETAPKGTHPEDAAPPAIRSVPAPPQAVPPLPQAEKPDPPPRTEVSRTPRETAPPPPQASPGTAPPAVSYPNLAALTQLTPTTLARLEKEWRKKYREEVAEGNAVWLDTEKDILISFFQRFRDHIYGVWNYPSRSAERGEEGTCLLKITVNRDGSLAAVRLMESSGYPQLDREAISAIEKGAPFGKLPRAYEEEQLNIFAFFQYNLSNRIIY